ncbi:MAG: toprim domain-containing protein [Anaerolineae bacterium]|jgi:hypothetical protein|nr:toprim domain-containing protein [Anaerolineae bacterium]
MDIEALLRRVDLAALAEAAGARFEGQRSSHCPLHGGDNPTAFHLYTGADGRQRWHCFTRCPPGRNDGDALAFWSAWRKVDFPTALRELAAWADGEAPVALNLRGQVSSFREGSAKADLAPPPGPVWCARAARFTAWAARQLWGEAGGAARRYLHGRGLRDTTLLAARVGWNPRLLRDRPAAWGYPADDWPVLLHAGVTLPHVLRTGEVQGVKVRCFEMPGVPVLASGYKYRGPRGGRMALYGRERWAGLPVLLLVEGEFDALLAWQEAGDLLDVATLAGARANLDVVDALALLEKAAVVAVYDADAAGQAGAATLAARWARVTQVAPPDHDLTDCWVHGGDLRAWLAGVAAEQLEGLLARVGAVPAWQALWERCRVAAALGANVGT